MLAALLFLRSVRLLRLSALNANRRFLGKYGKVPERTVQVTGAKDPAALRAQAAVTDWELLPALLTDKRYRLH
jgi:hypothetical protein